MNNKIFISYKNEEPDKTIATKLFQALHSDYFRVFLDQKRLDAGTPWDQQLRENVNNADHILVVWSSRSRVSDWVLDEITTFRNKGGDGLIFFVCLDDQPDAYNKYQLIKDIQQANLPEDDIGSLSQNLFDTVVNKIRTAVYKKEGSKAIKRAVFTLTKNRLQGLRNVDVETIKNNYGEIYSEWKPFGSNRSIENILDEFLYVDINQKAKRNETLFHWEDIDWKEENSRLWLDSTDNNIDIIDMEIKQLGDSYCVLALDPFALNNAIIKERFGWCYEQCYTNEKALIMSLSAFPLSSQFEALRKQLRRDANMFYNNCFNPPIINNIVITNAFAHLADGFEVKRQLQITLLSQISRGGGNAFTQAKF
jgi:hypothetical protein